MARLVRRRAQLGDSSPRPARGVLVGTLLLGTAALLMMQVSSVGAQAPDGFTALFDGHTLQGWTQRNGVGTYEVIDGVIEGTSQAVISVNSFLCTAETYSDFDLLVTTRIDTGFNSGIQIRSRTAADLPNGRVFGPQVEIAADGEGTTGFAGFLYGEALGTDWLQLDLVDSVKQTAFQAGAWNRFRIRAEGEHIRTWVNDVAVTDFVDTVTGMTEGLVCLQVHTYWPSLMPDLDATGPFRVWFKDIYIKELGG